jgi:hypothetical protein
MAGQEPLLVVIFLDPDLLHSIEALRGNYKVELVHHPLLLGHIQLREPQEAVHRDSECSAHAGCQSPPLFVIDRLPKFIGGLLVIHLRTPLHTDLRIGYTDIQPPCQQELICLALHKLGMEDFSDFCELRAAEQNCFQDPETRHRQLEIHQIHSWLTPDLLLIP